MPLEPHSEIILNEHSVNALIMGLLGEGSPVKTLSVTHEDDHLHLNLGIDYDNAPGGIDLPFIGKVHPLQKLMGNHVEADLRLAVSGPYLKGNLDFCGFRAVIQKAMSMLGVASIIFFFAPRLKKIGAIRINGLYDFDIDLSEVTVPDGRGGEVRLADLVKIHSISVGKAQESMLHVEFSIIEQGKNNHVENTTASG